MSEQDNQFIFDDVAKTWNERIIAAKKEKENWENKFKTEKLEAYYEGDQWEKTGSTYEPYVINYFFSSIEVQLPSLLFQSPIFHVKPRPRKADYDFEVAVQKAQLREDIINTLAGDDDLALDEAIEDAVMDNFFRFGVVEVGYSADWIENPEANKPILKSDEEHWTDEKGNVIRQPEKVPTNERLFVKRINPERFIVGGNDSGILSRCDWCAYYEWFRIEDILANKSLKNLDKINWPGGRSSDFVPNDSKKKPDISPIPSRQGDLLKCWHIFNNRKGQRLLIAESPLVVLKDDIEYERLPIFDIRFHKCRKGFYPVPPTSNWRGPQNEINECREQARNHRKRFNRKYVYRKSAFPDSEELDKLMNGGDGTYAASELPEIDKAVYPIPDAPLNASAMQELVVTKDDFNIISGTSSEQRGQADRTTATQANLIDQRSQVRESRTKVKIAKWLSRIGKEMLLQFEENFTTGSVFVEMVAAPNGDANVPSIWHEIKATDLKGRRGEFLDYDVSISIDSLSPIANNADLQAYVQFLSIVNQFPQLSVDPLLIREAAYRCGYRNEQVIRRMQQAAELMLTMQMSKLQDAALTQTMNPQQNVQNAAGPQLIQAMNMAGNQGQGVQQR